MNNNIRNDVTPNAGQRRARRFYQADQNVIDQTILDAIEGLSARLGNEHQQNTVAISELKADFEQIRADLAGAFPNGDASAHRRYHESAIEWRELRNRMVLEALTQAAKAGGVAGIGWIVYALWVSFKMEIQK